MNFEEVKSKMRSRLISLSKSSRGDSVLVSKAVVKEGELGPDSKGQQKYRHPSAPEERASQVGSAQNRLGGMKVSRSGSRLRNPSCPDVKGLYRNSEAAASFSESLIEENEDPSIK